MPLNEQIERKAAALQHLSRFGYRHAWWLPGPHLQTIYSSALRRAPRCEMRRERWDTPDDDFLDLYHTDGDPDRPTVLMLHGLEGSIRSPYMRGLAHAFAARRWNVVAMEFRSCGGEINRARRLYHSGETTDLEFVVGGLIERHPQRRIYIAGVSLGGNVTAKWLGERGDGVPEQVAAAAAVSPPFDLTVSGPHMDAVWGGFYVRQFMRSLIPKALAKIEQYPGCLDPDAVRRARTFAEFDTVATARMHGFRDAQDYWEQVSCARFLAGIRRPTLLVASADDPFNPGSTLPRAAVEASPFLHSQFTERGGHVGFVAGSSPVGARYWAEEQIVRFFTFYEGDAASM